MSSSNDHLARRVGAWSATGLAVLGLLYLLIWTAMLATGAGYPPPEPYQTVLHLIPLILAPVLIVFLACLHTLVGPERRFLTLSALACACVFVGMTTTNRYVALTAFRQSIITGQEASVRMLSPYAWPSAMLAIEVLGWGLFFGLACLLLVPLFRGRGLPVAIAFSLAFSGVSNLASLLGPAMNNMSLLGLLAPLAWGIAPTVTFSLLAVWLKRGAGWMIEGTS